PITIVATLRPVRPLPFSVAEVPAKQPARNGRGGLLATGFRLADRVLKVYDRLPVNPVRTTAISRAVKWILDRQEADGGWGGIQPPWVYSLLALELSGQSIESRAMAAGIRGLEGFLVREQTPEGPVRRLEACQSPVWDTALALNGLLDAGVSPEDPMVQ